MAKETKTNRTLDALRRAIGTTDGTDCTAFWLWAMNDGSAGATAAIGDGDRLASALLALLNRVGEGRAMPQEMMLTRAVLMAVAAADVRNGGQLLEVIRQHRDAILSGAVTVKNGYGEDLLDDDDDNIVTKDGRKWTDYDHKEIRQHRMNYLSLSEDMTLTQFRMEMIKGKALCNTMVGTLYKGMLLDDLAVGKEWFEELMAARKGTAEFDCYYTFSSHGIFRLAQNDAYERMYNHNRQ